MSANNTIDIDYIGEMHCSSNANACDRVSHIPEERVVLVELHRKVSVSLQKNTPLYVARGLKNRQLEYVDVRYDIPFMYHHCMYVSLVWSMIPFTDEEQKRMDEFLEQKGRGGLSMKEVFRVSRGILAVEDSRSERCSVVMEDFSALFWSKLTTTTAKKEYWTGFFDGDLPEWERQFFTKKGWQYGESIVAKMLKKSRQAQRIMNFVKRFYEVFPWELLEFGQNSNSDTNSNDKLSPADFINLADMLYMDVYVALRILDEPDKKYTYVAGLSHTLCLRDILDYCRHEKSLEDLEFSYVRNPFGVSGGGHDKVFYKGYYYKVRSAGKKQYIKTKIGDVSLANVRKWSKTRIPRGG